MQNSIAVNPSVEPLGFSDRPQISIYIATSMDGYIAKENDGLDWLENINLPGLKI